MKPIEREPIVTVGLMADVVWVEFELHSEFVDRDGTRWAAGSYRAEHEGGGPGDNGFVEIRDSAGELCAVVANRIDLQPTEASGSFTIKGVTIGIDFHWQRKEDQRFQGVLRFRVNDRARFDVINEIGVESYLTSVISSEMSAMADGE